MKFHSSVTAAILCSFLGAGVTACKPGKTTPAAKAGRAAILPVIVETRADGVVYLPGATTPFTGEAILPYPDMPWLVKMREPYRDGKRDGDKLELFKNGLTKSLRRYERGTPKYTATFHRNGQMKFELQLNAQDRGEGPYTRWYPDGVVEATAGLDAEERWHGVFKEWTPAGELKTHHVFDHGKLQQILFETPESREARLAVGLELEKPPVAPAPVPAENPPPAAPAAPAAPATPPE